MTSVPLITGLPNLLQIDQKGKELSINVFKTVAKELLIFQSLILLSISAFFCKVSSVNFRQKLERKYEDG